MSSSYLDHLVVYVFFSWGIPHSYSEIILDLVACFPGSYNVLRHTGYVSIAASVSSRPGGPQRDAVWCLPQNGTDRPPEADGHFTGSAVAVLSSNETSDNQNSSSPTYFSIVVPSMQFWTNSTLIHTIITLRSLREVLYRFHCLIARLRTAIQYVNALQRRVQYRRNDFVQRRVDRRISLGELRAQRNDREYPLK